MANIVLGDIVKVISEHISNPSTSGYDRFVGLEHYDAGEPVITRFGDTASLTTSVKHFVANDILVARRNVYLKRAGVVRFEGVTSGDSIVLRVVDEHYAGIIPFVLNTDDFWDYAEQNADGTMSKRLSPDILLEYEFDIPDNHIEIADKLWAAYELKEAYKKMIAATDEMVKSQFIEMFEGGKYPYVALKDIASEWLKGQAFRKDDIIEDGLTLCIHYGELFTKYGPIIRNVTSRTNADKKRLSRHGDILFPASDVTPNGLARCSMLPFDNVILGGDLIVLRLKDGYNPAYISCAINQQTAQLLIRVNGAVVKHMAAKSLMTVEIPIAPIEKQDKFVAIVEQADKSKFESQQAIEKIDKVMKSLLQ